MAVFPGMPQGSHHILIVEDDPSVRRILRFLLETEGFQVSEAENGRHALAWLEKATPDLVILDWMMPEMDGMTACRQIRRQRRLSQIPIIFLTARNEGESKVMSLEGGANDFLTKPYSGKELLLRVRNMLVLSRAQRDANPLTGLPGNGAIEAETQARLDSGEPFALLYLDLDNFKAYNDSYSYRAGDRVLRFVADMLGEAIEACGNPGDFVGHVGGDDFVALTTPDRADAVGTYVVEHFDRRILDYYRPEDRARGFVELENRRFQTERFPLVSVTIAVVESDRYEMDHIAALNDIVTGLKKRGKQIPGSVVVRDQRQGTVPLPRTGSDG